MSAARAEVSRIVAAERALWLLRSALDQAVTRAVQRKPSVRAAGFAVDHARPDRYAEAIEVLVDQTRRAEDDDEIKALRKSVESAEREYAVALDEAGRARESGTYRVVGGAS